MDYVMHGRLIMLSQQGDWFGGAPVQWLVCQRQQMKHCHTLYQSCNVSPPGVTAQPLASTTCEK